MKHTALLSLALIFFAFTSCKEDKYLDWKYINQQWYEQQKQMAEQDDEWNITSSGLLYKVINAGIGNDDYSGRPSDKSAVTIAYTGSYINNASFDSQPGYSEYLAGFVLGFQEAVKLMKLNGIYEVIIPYELAYGEDGNGVIPPYSVLKFKIELIDFWTQ